MVLCSEKDEIVAHYALDKIGNKVLAREYQLNLPEPEEIAARVMVATNSSRRLPAKRERGNNKGGKDNGR